MIYTQFSSNELSMLGMGFMRLPFKNGNYADVDFDKSEQLVYHAIEKGINYFDTAWEYAGSNSEVILGNTLKKYPRSSFYLATKFPGYDLDNFDKAEEIFDQQLERLQTDYIDFYLLHNVCELNLHHYLNNEKYGIVEMLLEKKRNVQIKHLGFSTHARPKVLKSFLNVYGKDMEFAQIQLNCFDWEFQNAKEKVEILKEYNLPIWVMEPLRGGSLCRFDKQTEEKMLNASKGNSISSWSFRFLQSIPEVKLILSGMSTIEQIDENTKCFEMHSPLSSDEQKVLNEVVNNMLSKKIVPCTKCKYCIEHCPMDLDIPRFVEMFNEQTYSNGGFIVPMELEAMEEQKLPSHCIHCKKCEAVCPQNIKITKINDELSKLL